MIDVDRYLQRIDYRGPVRPTTDVLAALQVAHLRTVPFENLSIHRREGISLDEGRLFAKVVERRRGGFCYELNGLFAALLRRLGFDVDLLSARVHQENGTYSPEFDHLTLLVRPPHSSHGEKGSGARYLVDVGFGEAFLRPLRLRHGLVQEQGEKAFALEEASGAWTLSERSDGPFVPVYRFTLEPHALADFADRCRFHQHDPASHFAKKTVCTLATPGGRITLSGDRLIVTEGGERTDREVAEGEHDGLLRHHFGIVTA